MGAPKWLAGATRLAFALLALSPMAAAGAQDVGGTHIVQDQPRPWLLQVSLNGRALDEPVMLLRSASAGFYASSQSLRDWRMGKLEAAPRLTFDGREWIRIDGDPRVRLRFSEMEQSLDIEASPDLFERQRIGVSPDIDVPMSIPASGVFVNYDTFLEYSTGRLSGSGSTELVAFTSKGVGAATFIGRFGQGGPGITRLETNWTIDRPERMLSIRLGDGIARSGFGMAPVRFAGVQIARNFDVQPGFITFPLPSLEGSAALPSVAEVYVDSVLRGSRAVDPGPFTWNQVPVRSGGGTVQIVTRDLLGREVAMTQNYYASTSLLRKGLHDFSSEIGFLRQDFGAKSNSYGRFIASTLHRYGLSDRITLEGSARLSGKSQTGAVAITATLLDLAQITGSAGLSRSRRGTGGAAGLGIERRGRAISLGVRTEFRSASYHEDGESEDRRARFIAQAFADFDTRWGSVGVNYFRRDNRTGADDGLLGISANVRAGSRSNLQLYARRAVSGESQTVVGAFLGITLGNRRSASASIETQGGRFVTRSSMQQDAPPGIGGGFRATAEQGRSKAFNLEYRHNGALGTYTAEVARHGSNYGVRLSSSGSAGLIGGSPFAARRLGSSFAEVRVGQPGVRVYADNRLIGVTGRSGNLVIPELRAYETNPIRIDDADLPLSASADTYETSVRPFARTGNIVKFDVKLERGVLLRLVDEDGRPLSAGAEVAIAGKNDRYVVAGDGELYVLNLSGRVRLLAAGPTGRCEATLNVPDNGDLQPKIDRLVCRTVRHAAR